MNFAVNKVALAMNFFISSFDISLQRINKLHPSDMIVELKTLQDSPMCKLTSRVGVGANK